MSGSRVWRLAVAGGRRGGSFNAALEHLKDRVKLVAICDTLESVRQRWEAGHPGIQTFDDFETMVTSGVCDAVLIATPMLVHASQTVAALNAGVHVVSEVTACTSHEQAVAMIQAVKASKCHYMMAENYVYRRPQMMVEHMARTGVFGDITSAEGMYVHDCRMIKFENDGSLTWRGELGRDQRGGVYYPTHSLGPVAKWLDLGGVDDIATVYSVSTPGLCMADFTKRRFGENHPGADASYWQRGDGGFALLTTKLGRVITLRVDSSSARPHHMTQHELQGTRGCVRTDADCEAEFNVWLAGRSVGWTPENQPLMIHSNNDARWDKLSRYAYEYEHPRWREFGEQAIKAGHGGGDFFVLEDFINTLDGRIKNPIDIYDAVSWSSIGWLSEQSVVEKRVVEAIDYRQY